MVTDKDKIRLQGFWPLWRWVFTGLDTLALVLSAIMSWHFLAGGTMVGCGGGSPCEQVLNSQWSVIAGIIPISGLAMGLYLALLVASFFIGPGTEAPIRRLAWSAMLIMAGAVAGSAVWFTILQKWVIGNFCPYCITTHITGLLLTVLVFSQARKEFGKQTKDIQVKSPTKVQRNSTSTPFQTIRPLSGLGLGLIGLVLSGILATCQVVLTPSAVYSDGESQNKLPVFDYHTSPMVGSPNAPYVVTLLFDYQCPHCQKIHFMLDEAINRYNGKLAFVLCPAPLNTNCNPYVQKDVEAFKNSCELAKISLAVWVARPDAFFSFENWMYTFESGDMWHPRSLETTRAKAVELVGREKFDAAFTNPWIGEYMQNCVEIYGQTIRNGQSGIPKLIFGSRWVIPTPYDADEFVIILQNSLAVPKPSANTK